MENWRYDFLNKNENIQGLKVSGNERYLLKTVSATKIKAPHFIIFIHDSLTLGTEAEIKVNNWKIHLSITPKELAKAWDIIFPILAKHECELFKIINMAAVEAGSKMPDFPEALLTKCEGSQITIYPIPGLEWKYRLAVIEVEKALKDNGIHPGKFDEADRLIGAYASVRHTGEVNSPSGLLKTYNPDNVPEVFYPVEHSNFINELKSFAISGKIRNKRSAAKRVISGYLKQVNDVFCLQDLYHFIKSPDCDFLRRKKKKILFMSIGGTETLAYRAIVKAIRKRLMLVVKQKQVLNYAEDAAVKDILGARRLMNAVDNKFLRKYQRWQKKGIVKILGGNSRPELRYRMQFVS